MAVARPERYIKVPQDQAVPETDYGRTGTPTRHNLLDSYTYCDYCFVAIPAPA